MDIRVDSRVSNSIKRYRLPKKFRIAIREARLSTFGPKSRSKHGAVLFKGSKCIASGHNKRRTHPRVSEFTTKVGKRIKFVAIHAELDCIIGVPQDTLAGSVLYVYRGSEFGEPLLSKPCAMCMVLMKEKGVKEVVFTTTEAPYFDAIRL